jgi:hypothetical protein
MSRILSDHDNVIYDVPNVVPQQVEGDPQVVPVLTAPVPIPLINSLIERLKKLKHKQPLMLPIKTIHNINVEVSILKRNKKIYEISIIPIDFCVNGDSLLEDMYERLQSDANEDDFLRRVIEYILRDLKNIQIDKFYGRFVTYNTPEQLAQNSLQWSEFYQEFKDNENITLTMNECCVCFTLTETSTNCGHVVCLECVSKLRTVTEEEGTRRVDHKNCPMCRQKITDLN